MVTITFQVNMAPVKELEDRESEASSSIAVAGTLAGQIHESVKRDLQQNKAALSHLAARKRELLRAMEEARAAVEVQQQKVDRQRADLVSIEQVQTAFQGKVAAAQSETARLGSDIQLHRDEIVGVTAELEVVNREIANAKAVVGVAIQDGEVQVANLKAAIDEKRARADEIEQMSRTEAARVEAELELLSRTWYTLDTNVTATEGQLNELKQQHDALITAKEQEVAGWEVQKAALEAGLVENEKQLSEMETNLGFHQASLKKLESDEQLLGARWAAHVEAIATGDAAITSAAAKVLDVDAQTKETEARAVQLAAEIEASSQEVSRLKFTAGMVMTTIGMGFRITRQLFKGLNAQFDDAISYLASMFSHVATMAWQASAIAAGTGNVVMSMMHAVIATMAAAQGTAALVERNQQRQQAEYNQEIYMGER